MMVIRTVLKNSQEKLVKGEADEMGIKYLCGVLDAAVGDAEGMDGPIEIESLLRFTKRKAFSESCFINLDDLNSKERMIRKKMPQ